MLGIIKVNAGIAVDASTEFSVSIVDEYDNVYEVQIDDRAYAQLVSLIEETTNIVQDRKDTGVDELRPEGDLQYMVDQGKISITGSQEPPQHQVDEEATDKNAYSMMESVGFDFDYSAEYEEEEDPGEEVENNYVEQL